VPEPPIDLVVSIGHLGDFATLAKCLDSIAAHQISIRHEIWIVYNGPGGDGVVEQIRARFPPVRIFDQRGPLGYCGTHNLALRAALDEGRARYVLLLDDDTLVAAGNFDRMVSFMDQHPRVGMAGCKTLNPDGTFQQSFALMNSWKLELRTVLFPNAQWPAHLYRDLSSVRSVDWLNGSYMLVRCETLRRVGLLDEHYYTYNCEADWAYRIQQAGDSVVFVPDTEIVHVGRTHSIQTMEKSYSSLVRHFVNRYYFFHKHRSRLECLLLRPVMVLAMLARMVRFALVYLRKPELRSIARTRLRAMARVVRLSFSPRPYEMPNDL
jgi:hypothetical protein